MGENAYLFVVPIVVSFILIPLRRQRPLFWWLLLLAVALVIAGVLLLRAEPASAASELVGTAILLLGPLVAMFVVLRAGVFRRRLYLIPLLGPVVYLVGVAVALSVVVTLGLLQP